MKVGCGLAAVNSWSASKPLSQDGKARRGFFWSLANEPEDVCGDVHFSLEERFVGRARRILSFAAGLAILHAPKFPSSDEFISQKIRRKI